MNSFQEKKPSFPVEELLGPAKEVVRLVREKLGPATKDQLKEFTTPQGKEIIIKEYTDLEDDIQVLAAGIDPFKSGLFITVRNHGKKKLYLPRRPESVDLKCLENLTDVSPDCLRALAANLREAQ